jgi:hypothetical protein
LIQDYGFRLYNPAIGKFLSVDPLAPDYPFYSPYQFAGNTPIVATDVDGLEPQVEDGRLVGYIVQKHQGFSHVAADINNPLTQKRDGYCLSRKVDWEEIMWVSENFDAYVVPELRAGNITVSELDNAYHIMLGRQ